jgi:hypothetical protein
MAREAAVAPEKDPMQGEKQADATTATTTVANCKDSPPSAVAVPPLITDDDELICYGVVRLPLPDDLDAEYWAAELSQVTPAILTAQGDGEYAFYRNILEEPDFPLSLWEDCPGICAALERYFGVKTDDLRLDDAFCVHYDDGQDDSGGARHMDPSDLTLNLCLEKSSTVEESHVLFFGTQALANEGSPRDNTASSPRPRAFCVPQIPGTLSLHWGCHPHQTLPLKGTGCRTNIVMTLCYKDPNRSDVMMRTCY